MTEKYEFIDGEFKSHPVRHMCASAKFAKRRTKLEAIIRKVFADAHET